jgi:prepilin-type N-terminal cleavage/methylation domain-containing protein
MKLRRTVGFTLIELIVVMAVLTVLAGLVLPKLDVFKLKANKASAASNIHGVDRFVTGYKVQKDVFPDQWDSLLDATNTTALWPGLDPQLIGGTVGSPTKLTTTTIATNDELRSLNRVGLLTVLDHVNGGFPGDSASSGPRTFTTGDTLATINAADPDGQRILNQFYPMTGGAVPPGKKVVVFGFGPRNQIIGDSLHAAPFYANTDQLKYYNRFLVCFELDTGGGRARLLGSLGADGDTINEEIIDFYEN